MMTGLIVGTALIIGVLQYRHNTSVHIAREVERLNFTVEKSISILDEIISAAPREVLFLASAPPVRGIVRVQKNNGIDPVDGSSVANLKSRLAQIFTLMATGDPNLLQLRLIAANGQELVRVDRQEQGIVRIPDNKLQNKSKRDYVELSHNKPVGTVSFFGIDLNRERGVIETPHMAVLRATTPVYSKSGKYFGLIVININMNYVLKKVSNLFERNHILYLTNNTGDFIVHPDKSKIFGFDLGRRYQMQHEFKAVEPFFAPDAPKKLTIQTADAKGEVLAHLAKYRYNKDNSSVFLVVAAISPISSLFAQDRNARDMIIWATAILALIGAALAVIFSNYILRPLNTLSKATELLARGASLDTIEVPIEQSNLVGSLSRCFLRMATTLKEKETSIEAILSTASNPIITIDCAGVIQEANDATSQLFGYSRDELLGANVTLLMTDEVRERHNHFFTKYQERDKSETSGTARQVEAQHKDGTIVPIHIAVSEISLHNQRMFTAIITDLTELKKLDKMKDEFISTVSHELRTPLTSIKGALGLLDSPLLGDLPEQAKSMIGIAHNNSNRLVRLINDVLDIEKIEAGKMNFTLKEVELSPFLARVVDANRTYALQFMVVINLAPIDENLKIMGDPDRLEQVVTNLLSNAVKYSPRGGRVFVTAESRADRVRISIRDEGSGIPEEFQKKIFSKFAQADASDTRAHSGTGLGLTISKAIVEQHSGTIGFDTIENKGTTFYFELPLLNAETSEAEDNLPAVSATA